MEKIIAWRLDDCPYPPGFVMRSRGDHITDLPEANRNAEIAIREAMVDGHIIRAKSLYVWRDFDWARKYWTLQPNKYLYKLEVDCAHIRHSGDVNYYSDIADALRIKMPPEFFVNAYITGKDRDSVRHHKDQVELLLEQATVIERYDPPPSDEPCL